MPILIFLDKAINHALRFTAVFTSVLMMLTIVFYLIFFRYVLNESTTYSTDIIQFCAMWLYMAGMALSSRNKDHLRIDLLETQLKSPVLRCIQQFVVSVISTVLCAFFVYISFLMIRRGILRPQTTSTGLFPLLILQTSFMFSSVLCLIYAIRDMVIYGYQLISKQYKDVLWEES